MVNVEVDGPPKRVLEGFEVNLLASDRDPSLATIPSRWHQFCELHFRRLLERSLVDSQGRQIAPEERARWVHPLVGALAHLRNSVALHNLTSTESISLRGERHSIE